MIQLGPIIMSKEQSSSSASEYSPMQRVHETLFSYLKDIPKKDQSYTSILKKTSYNTGDVDCITEPLLQNAELHLCTIYSYVFNCTMVRIFLSHMHVQMIFHTFANTLSKHRMVKLIKLYMY